MSFIDIEDGKEYIIEVTNEDGPNPIYMGVLKKTTSPKYVELTELKEYMNNLPNELLKV